MKKTIPLELIAPCGMNCAICSKYLAYVNELDRNYCRGCRPGNKKCSYLFAKCSGINSALEGNASASFCFECDQYPCRQIDRMDKRYKENYEMSVKENLEFIHKLGTEKFFEEQYKKYHCSQCGGLISIHNRKCFKCHTVTKLVEKRNKKY
ncbi:MAG: DUF3795 domain-containing protein [Armatimonadetes bacterium]|nr:DUF3795 domain-containing protein [Armatimonadota bacterium]